MTIALSYSRLSVFEQCEARFDYQYVSKRVQDQANEASAYGDRVHKVLEQYGQGSAPRGVEAQQTLDKWGPLVDTITRRPGDKFFEHQMAVNQDLQPVDWFAKDVWIRAIADVLVVDGDTAYVLDWKTGKVKENPTQLQLFAAMVMWHFPQVTKVQTSFVWLAYNEVTNSRYERRYLDALWRAIKPRFDKVQEVVDLGVYKTKPGPLCPWCPAKDICPDARLRR
jgi:ATP-dependent exoDNAse (exonuclease V) beta subunit